MASLILKRKPFALNKENVKDDLVNKREKEKLQKVIHTFSCLGWEVSNFANKLRLCCEGLNPCKEIIMSIVALEELTFVFGARQQNGWKANVNEVLIEKDCETLCKLYEDVYAHPPPNGDYLAIFLRNWLPQNKDV
jgi:hypothetical protein